MKKSSQLGFQSTFHVFPFPGVFPLNYLSDVAYEVWAKSNEATRALVVQIFVDKTINNIATKRNMLTSKRSACCVILNENVIVKRYINQILYKINFVELDVNGIPNWKNFLQNFVQPTPREYLSSERQFYCIYCFWETQNLTVHQVQLQYACVKLWKIFIKRVRKENFKNKSIIQRFLIISQFFLSKFSFSYVWLRKQSNQWTIKFLKQLMQ